MKVEVKQHISAAYYYQIQVDGRRVGTVIIDHMKNGRVYVGLWLFSEYINTGVGPYALWTVLNSSPQTGMDRFYLPKSLSAKYVGMALHIGFKKYGDECVWCRELVDESLGATFAKEVDRTFIWSVMVPEKGEIVNESPEKAC